MRPLRLSDPRSRSSLFLHGRQVPWMLHNHNRLQPRTDCRRLRRLLAGSVPADWWQGKVDRGLLVQEEVDV